MSIVLKTIEEEAADCRAAWAAAPNAKYGAHIHHEVPCEALTEPIEARISFILVNKVPKERALRLRLMRPTTEEAFKAYDAARAEAQKAYGAAMAEPQKAYYAARAEAFKAYDAAMAEPQKAYDAARAEAFKAYDAARAEAQKAVEAGQMRSALSCVEMAEFALSKVNAYNGPSLPSMWSAKREMAEVIADDKPPVAAQSGPVAR